MDDVYDAKDTTRVWENIAKRYEVDLSMPLPKDPFMHDNELTGVIRSRSYPRRFDLKRIGNATKQRICELVLLDYCCLNMPLPPPCEKLYCRLNHSPHDGRKLQIQPWVFPSSATTTVLSSST